jgi:hypothetical protein
VQQGSYIRLRFTIENDQVEALLRQSHARAHRFGAQLHLDAKFFQDAPQHFD